MQVKDATGDTTRLLVIGDPQRGEYAPLVALWLRVTQIVFHHADEGAAQVLVGMSSGRTRVSATISEMALTALGRK